MCAEKKVVGSESENIDETLTKSITESTLKESNNKPFLKNNISITPSSQVVYFENDVQPIKEQGADFLGGLTLLSVCILAIFNILNTRKVAVETKKLEMETNSLKKSISLNQKTFIENTNSIRRREIQNQLEVFFAPFKSLRIQSSALYQIFALEAKGAAEEALEQRQLEQGEEIKRKDLTVEEINRYYFGVVRYLTAGNELPQHDQKLLSQIVKIGNSLLELIKKSTFVLKNSALNQLLGEYGAHIVILNMTEKGELKSVTEAANLSMPLEIDGAIESAIMKLELEYESLMPDYKKRELTLIDSEQETVSYYNDNALDFFNRTVAIDLADIYAKFRKNISKGGLILDAGCGIGRDTRYFIKSGYKVRSFDASEEMVKYCSQYPHAFCEQRSFLDVNELEQYDGVWANASLIHLNNDRFISAMKKLASSVKVGGTIYLSLKAANNTSNDGDSRNFYYHEESLVESILNRMCFEKIEIWENVGRKEGQSTNFTNYLFKKSSRVTSPEAR